MIIVISCKVSNDNCNNGIGVFISNDSRLGGRNSTVKFGFDYRKKTAAFTTTRVCNFWEGRNWIRVGCSFINIGFRGRMRSGLF